MRVFSTFCLCFCFFFLHGQGKTINYFHDLIDKSQTTEDTIASILTLKIISEVDSTGISQAIDDVLKDAYPLWAELENDLLNKSEITDERLEKLHDSCGSSELKKLIRFYSDMKMAKEGDKIDFTSYTEDYNNNNEVQKIVSLFYQINLHDVLKDKKFLTEQLGIIDQLSEEKYPILKLTFFVIVIQEMTKKDAGFDEFFAKANALSESIGDYFLRMKLHNHLLILLKNIGDYETAIETNLKTIEYAKKAGWKTKIVESQLNLSTFHQEQGQFDKAYELIDKVRKYAEELNDTLNIAKSYSSVGFAKMNESKYDEAIFKLNYANEILERFQGTEYYRALNTVNIVSSYHELGDLDSAYTYFIELEKLDPKNRFGYNNFAKTFIARYHVENKNYKIAQEFIDAGMEDAIAYDDKSGMSVVLLAQSKLYEGQGKYEKALEVFKKHMEIEQDFRNEENAAQITKAQMNSEFENEKKILALTNEKESLKLTNERNRAIGIGGAGVLVAGLSLLFFYFIWNKNKKIKIQNTKLEELNSVKDTLFQIIGHDLKKPTINFRNVSRSINYLLDKGDFKRLRALGEDVDKDAKRLYNLTDNLLSWALVQKDSININPEKIDVRDLVEQNLELFRGLAERKNISLVNSVSEQSIAFLDRNSLDTVIRNLVDNALKYTNENGKIELGSKEVEGMIQVNVIDTGIGINRAMLDQLNLGEINQSTTGTNGEKGNGIGLSLVKQLLLKNKSKLKIMSEPDKGSKFIIELPIPV